MEPVNPPHYVRAFEASGLEVASRYVSAVRPASAPAGLSVSPDGLRIRNFDLQQAEAELARIHAISLEAFASNHFYQPISQEDFLAGYRPVLGAIDPELVLLLEYEAGELRVGYAALNVVGEPSVLGGAELIERDETIATVAAATPLLNAWSSIGRSSGTSRSRSAPVGKATCMTALMLS